MEDFYKMGSWDISRFILGAFSFLIPNSKTPSVIDRTDSEDMAEKWEKALYCCFQPEKRYRVPTVFRARSKWWRTRKGGYKLVMFCAVRFRGWFQALELAVWFSSKEGHASSCGPGRGSMVCPPFSESSCLPALWGQRSEV